MLFSRLSSRWRCERGPLLPAVACPFSRLHRIRVPNLRVPGRVAPCPKICPTGHTAVTTGPSLRYPWSHLCINPLIQFRFAPLFGGCSAGAVPPLQTCACSVCLRWYQGRHHCAGGTLAPSWSSLSSEPHRDSFSCSSGVLFSVLAALKTRRISSAIEGSSRVRMTA